MTEETGGGASRSTDPAAGTSSGTDVSLREYLMQAIQDSRRECRDNIQNLERHFDQVQRHNEEVNRENMADISRRFDGVNEFRSALADLSKLMATKDNLSRVEEKFETSADGIRTRLATLERRIDVREGQETGSKITMGNLVVALTLGIGVIGVIVVLSNWMSGS